MANDMFGTGLGDSEIVEVIDFTIHGHGEAHANPTSTQVLSRLTGQDLRGGRSLCGARGEGVGQAWQVRRLGLGNTERVEVEGGGYRSLYFIPEHSLIYLASHSFVTCIAGPGVMSANRALALFHVTTSFTLRHPATRGHL